MNDSIGYDSQVSWITFQHDGQSGQIWTIQQQRHVLFGPNRFSTEMFLFCSISLKVY